ncbi:MAG: hypothetical protein L0Y79_01800 [Chlorobi bacterium]|nr:hypothetical protein [Chlorobiota bacterium]MCI0715141.1 hypothetical protein [Chlorobiota bacterium]
MAHKLKSALILIIISFFISSCTKEVPKELLENQTKPKQNVQQQEMPDDSIHRNLRQSTTDSDVKGDSKAEELTKEADEADAKYEKTKSEGDKKTCIQKQLTAANYLMFEANLSPKKKYRPALKRYRRVLELDPGNKEAMENKRQIEEIYEQMGMPIPD